MLPVIPLWFHIVLICGLLTLAIMRADREALIATLYVCASASLSLVVLRWRTDPHIPWTYIDLGWAGVDFAVLFTLAMVSRRMWTIGLGSVGILVLLTNLLAVFIPWPMWVTGTAGVIWYFVACAVLVVGCLRSAPRRSAWFALRHRVVVRPPRGRPAATAAARRLQSPSGSTR